MSTDLVIFSVRLREELDRLGLSLAAAARAAGEKDSERLKQIAAGRQRCPIELLSALEPAGVDVYYVLTGLRVGLATTLSARESALVNNYRAAPEEAKRALETTSAYIAKAPAGEPPPQKQTNISVGSNHGQVAGGGVVNNGPVSFGEAPRKKP